jgi:hypothetical protein
MPDLPFSYEWQHPVGDVVSALCAAGLRIEFPESPWCVPLLGETVAGPRLRTRVLTWGTERVSDFLVLGLCFAF